MKNSNIAPLDTESCSKWFRTFTENNGISATKLAVMIGISHGAVSNWINGSNTPSNDNWTAMGWLVGMEPYELIMSVQMGHTPPNINSNVIEAIDLLAGAEYMDSETLQSAYAKLPDGTGMRVISLISRLEASKFQRV